MPTHDAPHLTPELAKRLGAFYTPEEMAGKLVDWCIRKPSDRMVDPSFGGYVFLDVSIERLKELGASEKQARKQVYGVDMDEGAHKLAEEIGLGVPPGNLVRSDFFNVSKDDGRLPLFDANLGNPPYIRYQGWASDDDIAHRIAEESGYKLTKLASIWAPFVIHGATLLKKGGRMGQVLPAELLHAQYARPVLKFLQEQFSEVTIVLFEQKVFPAVLEEVVLLFAGGYQEGPALKIGMLDVDNVEALDLSRVDGKGDGYLHPEAPMLSVLKPATQRLYEKLSRDPQVQRFADLGSVDIGVVTGNNKFFVRSKKEIKDRGWDPSLFQPILGKATDVAGARVGKKDINEIGKRRATMLLVTAGATPEAMATIEDLIQEGRDAEVHTTYKTRIRGERWYEVPIPKVGVPAAFLTYMNDVFPRLLVNEAGALSTNTIHTVSLKDRKLAKALAVGFYNSLTLLSCELVGRSYGGGTLKLEPTEAEEILVPLLAPELADHLDEVDRLVRARDLEGLLELVDPLVLGDLVSDKELRQIREAREKLFQRRRTRSQAGKNGGGKGGVS